MTNKTIKGAISSIGLKGSNIIITIKAEIGDIRIDELKAYLDKNLELIIHDPQTDLDEFKGEEESKEGEEDAI